MKFEHNNFEIEILDEKTYAIGSTFNTNTYQHEVSGGRIVKERIFTINKRGLFVRNSGDQTEIASIIICENGGRTEINELLFKIEDNTFWISLGDKLYSLQLPSLEINWFSEINLGTIHTVQHFEGDFIVHGNAGIVRIDRSGEIKWRFSGKKRGVFTPGKERLTIKGNTIELIDGNEDHYLVDEHGNELT